MKLNRNVSRTLRSLLYSALIASPLAAASLSQTYTGKLPIESGNGSVVLESFSLTSASVLTIYTTSYGGGTNLDNSTTGPGGLQPNLTLYNSNGTAIGYQSPSFSPIANPDPSNGWKGDGYLQDTDALPGTYCVTLTDWQNQESITATGINLSMPLDAQFSGPGGTSFTDVQGNNRTGNYALDILATPLASSTPEPATLWLMIPALAGAVVLFRKRRASAV